MWSASLLTSNCPGTNGRQRRMSGKTPYKWDNVTTLRNLEDFELTWAQGEKVCRRSSLCICADESNRALINLCNYSLMCFCNPAWLLYLVFYCPQNQFIFIPPGGGGLAGSIQHVISQWQQKIRATRLPTDGKFCFTALHLFDSFKY